MAHETDRPHSQEVSPLETRATAPGLEGRRPPGSPPGPGVAVPPRHTARLPRREKLVGHVFKCVCAGSKSVP